MRKGGWCIFFCLFLSVIMFCGCGGQPAGSESASSGSAASSQTSDQEQLKTLYATVGEDAVESIPFGFRLPIPEGWRVLSEREIRELMGITEGIYQDDSSVQEALDESGESLVGNLVILINDNDGSVFQIQFTRAEDPDQSFEWVAEQLYHKTAAMAESAGELQETTFAGRPACLFEVTMNGNAVLVCCCIEGDCIMTIMGSSALGIDSIRTMLDAVQPISA